MAQKKQGRQVDSLFLTKFLGYEKKFLPFSHNFSEKRNFGEKGIYLVEKKPSKEVIEEVLDEIVIDIDTNENYSGETESVEESIEINKNVVDFLNDIK